MAGGRREPGTADLAGGVVKGDAAVIARADAPLEDALIEVRRAGYIGGRQFDVADFSVGKCRRHLVP